MTNSKELRSEPDVSPTLRALLSQSPYLFIYFILSFITQIIYNNSMIKVLGIKNNSHRPFILKYSNSNYIYTKHD